MSSDPHSHGRRSWSGGADGTPVSVTSDRLHQHEVANRWFPKVRSWIALGAPLELLSPLSVGRPLALIGLLTWPIGWSIGATGRMTAAVLTLASAVMVVWLLRSRAMTHRAVFTMVVLHILMVAAAIMSSSGSQRVIVTSVVVVGIAILAGLFGRSRLLIPGVVSGVTVVLLATKLSRAGMGFSDAGILVLFTASLTLMTALTARTSRLAGSLDPDTGVRNMRGMAESLVRYAARGEVIVATVHLRGVAEVRDAIGHGVGSELVKRAVEDLGQVLPSSALVGRGSDDDVVILVPNDPARATSTEALIAATVRQVATATGSGRYLVGDVEVALNAHIGVSTAGAGSDPSSVEDLLRQSAIAAHLARDNGQLVAKWDGTATTLTAEDLELLAALRGAAERGELWVAYQPQIRASDGLIVSVEALLRWTSPGFGNVPPGRFIPLAERTGLVDRLTDWVLAEALDAQARWRSLDVDVSVSVNVSPLSLRSVDFADRVGAAIDERGLAPTVLMLEVTESMAFDVPEAVERLAPLRARGVRISIDDFGTGYTSLAVLPHLPLDELKVDQQFVREARSSSASEAIVRSVCELAHRLGLSAVAEGVEDLELADLMTAFGFDLLQGYHFARPMAEPELLLSLALPVADKIIPMARI